MTDIFIPTPASTMPQLPGGAVRLPSGCTMTWHGWDGSTWDIGNPASPVRLAPGVRGLAGADVDFFDDELAGIDGIQENGWHVKARSVFWPLRVFTLGGGQDWLNLDSALWRTLQPGRRGVWEVTQPSGEARRLTLRCDGDGGHQYDVDPAVNGWTRYGVNLTAPDPYWRGDPVVRTWVAATGEPFFGGDGGGDQGPPFVISPSSTIGSAVMPNPGDVDEWPVWSVFGPTDTVTLGVNGHRVEVPFPIADGSALVVDSHPTAFTAYNATIGMDDTGRRIAIASTDKADERTGELGAAEWAPIPPGESVPLSLAMSGTGSIEASLTPGFYRAW